MLTLKFPKGGPRTATSGPPPWLAFISKVNLIEQGFFGQPSFVGKMDGPGNIEEYEHARVMFPASDPSTVLIVAKTEHGAEILKQASQAS